jgi:hypothetical protein
MARKRKKLPRARNVVDLEKKRLEKLTGELSSLVRQGARLLDEQVEAIVGAYHEWERDNPELAIKPFRKMAMVRLGFVGPGGFERCHEPGRLPERAFFEEDGAIADEIRSDRHGSETLMCPAMEARACQRVWQEMRMPPCYILLLEVHRGLGGGAYDPGVEEVIDDLGKWQGPEEYAESFARAEELLRRYK